MFVSFSDVVNVPETGIGTIFVVPSFELNLRLCNEAGLKFVTALYLLSSSSIILKE